MNTYNRYVIEQLFKLVLEESIRMEAFFVFVFNCEFIHQIDICAIYNNKCCSY